MSQGTSLPQQRLSVPAEVDEQSFFRDDDGNETLVTHADLEESVDNQEKPYLEELQRYWVNKPYSFVVIYRNVRDSELRYIVVEPRLSEIEREIVNFFRDKLQASLNYDLVDIDATPAERARVVRNETISLMKRYNLLDETTTTDTGGLIDWIKRQGVGLLKRQANKSSEGAMRDEVPAPRTPDGDLTTLNSVQVRRILYYLVRDFIRFDRIDPVKHDVNIEDISCNGYNTRVFVHHSEYGEQIATNVQFGKDDLDRFIKTMAQSAGKGISRRQPNIDATLPDGSRAQLTLGTELSDKGSHFTIRQFNEIPFTPIDLICWETYGLDQIVYLWLAIENNKSIIFGGGTASGKTTTLNAVSLFMPGTSKILSIEDTREIEIPQSNWVSNTTRDSFQEDGAEEIDEFDLLKDGLRKRPDFVIMGEVRGEEARSLFQMLNTGHTTYTTFHADSAREVIKRFTNDPINVSPSMFDALDIICMQESVDLAGTKVRRAESIVEIGEFDNQEEQFSMNDAFQWARSSDSFQKRGNSNILEQIKQENDWSDRELQDEMDTRRLILAYLIQHGIHSYAGVAATIQGYMTSPETVLALIADGQLENRIQDLHRMKTVDIQVEPEKEQLIPRPSPPEHLQERAQRILDEKGTLLAGYSSDDVEFGSGPATIEGEPPVLGRLDETDPAGRLPGEGGDGRWSGGDNPMGAGVSLDEELAMIFDQQSGVESDQMILTSKTLDRLNDQGAVSQGDTSADTQPGTTSSPGRTSSDNPPSAGEGASDIESSTQNSTDAGDDVVAQSPSNDETDNDGLAPEMVEELLNDGDTSSSDDDDPSAESADREDGGQSEDSDDRDDDDTMTWTGAKQTED